MSGLLMNKTGYISYSDPRFNYSYKGFCSIVCGIIDMALEHYIDNDNFNIKISEDQTLQFFENISPVTDSYYDAGSRWLEKFLSGKAYHCSHNAHIPTTISELQFRNEVYNSILKIREQYLTKFRSKKLEIGIDSNTLGVQIRGTDKKQELPEIQVESIFKLIDQTDKQKIFVATDDQYYLDQLLNRYGSRILYDSSLQISSGSKSLHHNCLDRAKINEEVLSSVDLLSECEHFLYSFSHVSLLALIIGATNFKFIDYLNK